MQHFQPDNQPQDPLMPSVFVRQNIRKRTYRRHLFRLEAQTYLQQCFRPWRTADESGSIAHYSNKERKLIVYPSPRATEQYTCTKCRQAAHRLKTSLCPASDKHLSFPYIIIDESVMSTPRLHSAIYAAQQCICNKQWFFGNCFFCKYKYNQRKWKESVIDLWKQSI